MHQEVDRAKIVEDGYLAVGLAKLVKEAGGGASCFGDAPGLFEDAKATAAAAGTAAPRLTIEGALCIAAASCETKAEAESATTMAVLEKCINTRPDKPPPAPRANVNVNGGHFPMCAAVRERGGLVRGGACSATRSSREAHKVKATD